MTRVCILRLVESRTVVGGMEEEEERFVKEIEEAARGRVMAERRGELEKRWKVRENSLNDERAINWIGLGNHAESIRATIELLKESL